MVLLSHIFPTRSIASRRIRRSGAESTKAGVRPAAPSAPTDALWTRWRFAAAEVEISFVQWCDSQPSEKELAFAVHRDALRREHAAAVLLAERCAATDSIAI